MHPVIFQTDLFGLLSKPFSLHTYGLLIASGFLAAMILSKRQGEREGEDGDRIVDLAFYLLLSGLIGARVVFILTKLDDYLRAPLEIFMFWRGGLVFYGGFIGAALYMAWHCRRYRLNFFKLVDIFIPHLAMAHAFGRLGCLAAGCCFGKPTDVDWGIVFPLGSMTHGEHISSGLVGYDELPHAVHPTQLYESGFEVIMFATLLFMRPFKRFHGQLFLTWLAVYPLFRSLVEMLRGDRERGVGVLGTPLSTSQLISVLVAIAAAVIFAKLRLSKKTPSQQSASYP